MRTMFQLVQALQKFLQAFSFSPFLHAEKWDSSYNLYKFCYANLAECSRAPNHPPASVSILPAEF